MLENNDALQMSPLRYAELQKKSETAAGKMTTSGDFPVAKVSNSATNCMRKGTGSSNLRAVNSFFTFEIWLEMLNHL